MKITKRKLRKIIKEERRKLLTEMVAGAANAERSLGSYANAGTLDGITQSIINLLQEVEKGAISDGLEEDEAEDMAANAALLAVAQAFQSAGMIAEYNEIYKLIEV